MRVLIIEDEFHAADRLKGLILDLEPEAFIMDVIDTVEGAVRYFSVNAAPDLVFMDIQLADGLSFEIFKHVTLDTPIIFTTAFDEYAVQAFKVNSVDYLLKPIATKALRHALDQYHKRHELPHTVPTDMLQKILEGMSARLQRNRFLLKSKKGYVSLNIVDIALIKSEDGISLIYDREGKRYPYNASLDQLENELPPKDFFRINRSMIIQADGVRKVFPFLNHRLKLEVSFPMDEDVVVSRNRVRDFKIWMGG